MSYCALTDLIARYGEDDIMALVDRDRTGTPDAALVEGVLADVDALIDAHLAGRYTLPLAQVPRVIVRIACELTREALMMAHGARLTDDAPERLAAQGARAMLKDIASGRLHIGLPTPASSAGGVRMDTGGRVWGRAEAEGYL